MSKLFLIFLSILVSSLGIAQKKSNITVEAGFHYVNYGHPNSSFNYGGSVFLYNQVGTFKYGIGINPNRNSYTEFYEHDGGGIQEQRFDYSSLLTTIQVAAIFGVKENKKFNINFSTGFNLNFVSNTSAIIYYTDQSTKDVSAKYQDRKGLLSWHFALVLNQKLTDKLKLVFVPSFNIRGMPLGTLTDDSYFFSYKNIINLKVGVSYRLSRK